MNHNGSFSIAKKLLMAAKKSGANAIKFQTFIPENVVTKNLGLAAYQRNGKNNRKKKMLDMIKKLYLNFDDQKKLHKLAKQIKIDYISSAFDIESLKFLCNKLNLKIIKIPSGEITNYPYLQCLAKIGKPVILSTGMANMDEIKSAIDVLTTNELNKNEITVLHCNTEYPTPMTDVNLLAMKTIGDELGVKIGYSDHTLGIEISVAAAALGARVIEKHFTLDRNLPGPDHRASLEPNELKSMVTAIRNVEIAISGSGKKEPSPSEIKNRTVVRKSLHTKRALRKGHLISEDDLIPLRPATGINPMEISTVLGCELKSDLSKSELISWKNLKKK